MNLNRRNFFKVISVTGATLVIGKELRAEPGSENSIEFSGVLYDSTRCAGCQTCESSCAEANALPAPVDTIQTSVIRKTDESHRTVVNAYNSSRGEVYIKKQCMHCNGRSGNMERR
jgi:formate dehydrogenase iron-sulfur subunit